MKAQRSITLQPAHRETVCVGTRESGMFKITLDMYQTLALAVLALLLGAWIKKRVSFLERFCIPAPVIGGLLFAVLNCILY